MKSKAEFLEYYEKLVENDTELQNVKSTLKAKNAKKGNVGKILLFVLCSVFFVITLIGLFPPLVLYYGFVFIHIGFCIFILGLLIFVIIPHYREQRVIVFFESKYKEKLVNFLLEDKQYHYDSQKYIDEKFFQGSKMYGYFNRYRGEDLVTISFPTEKGKVLIKFSDIDVENVSRDSDGNTSTSTVFNGVFGFVNFEKPFKFTMSVNHRQPKEQKVDLESETFNKKFKIYSNDQIYSRLVLTPDRIHKILNLKTPGYVKMALNQNTLYFGFEGAKLFSTQIKKDGVVSISVDDFYHDVELINTLIEEIKQLVKYIEE